MRTDAVFERIRLVVHQELDSHPGSLVQEVLQDLDLLLDVAEGLEAAGAVDRARLFMITDSMLADAFESPLDRSME